MTGMSKIRGVIALAASLSSASCVRPADHASGELAPKPTITFRNQDRDRIKVYLIGENHFWLIGRLEPLQTAHLALPEFGFASTSQAVSVAVVPGWSANTLPRRDPGGGATFSIDELTDDLPGEEWIFVNGQLAGPLRARVPGASASRSSRRALVVKDH